MVHPIQPSLLCQLWEEAYWDFIHALLPYVGPILPPLPASPFLIAGIGCRSLLLGFHTALIPLFHVYTWVCPLL